MTRIIERLSVVGGMAAIILVVFHLLGLVYLRVFFLVLAFLVPAGPFLLFFPIPYLVAAPFALRRLKRDQEDQKQRTVVYCSALMLVLLVVEFPIVLEASAAL